MPTISTFGKSRKRGKSLEAEKRVSHCHPGCCMGSFALNTL